MASLVDKMKLKPGIEAVVINAPAGYIDELKPLPAGVTLHEQLDTQYDWVQIFVKTRAELEAHILAVRQALKPQGQLWITFPKGTSKIQGDLTRDKGWESLQEIDLMWVNLISVNDTWSAFSLRPYKPGEKKQTFR